MNYIGGNWEKGLGATYASINPRNETILWEGNYASKDQIKSAIDCASQAHFKWSSLSFKERLEIIKNFYNLLNKEKCYKHYGDKSYPSFFRCCVCHWTLQFSPASAKWTDYS